MPLAQFYHNRARLSYVILPYFHTSTSTNAINHLSLYLAILKNICYHYSIDVITIRRDNTMITTGEKKVS